MKIKNMEESEVKVEFDVGSEVSIGHFFKSSFARSFVTSCRDLESSNFSVINDYSDKNSQDNSFVSLNDDKNNSFSLVNLDQPSNLENNQQFTHHESSHDAELKELNHLRKQCHALTEENRRLQNTLQMHEISQFQAIDNVMLQTQIDTLQWQLKQTEASRQMYRSLMKQVINFLQRAQKSLDNLHASNSRSHKTIGKSSRNLSIYADESSVKQSGSLRSLSPTSKFTRAKSVAQISSASGSSTFRDFTWSVLRRNDPVHCTPPRSKIDYQSQYNLNKSSDGILSRQRNDVADIKENSDNIPPGKLSQEAFRLMRTVESLLAMREPDLLTISSCNTSTASTPSSASSSSSAVVADDDNTSNSLIDHSVTTNSNKSTNSTSLDEETYHEYTTFNDHDGENNNTLLNLSRKLSSPLDDTSANNINNSNNHNSNNHNNMALHLCLPNGSHKSFDTASLNSASSKTTEEDDSRPPNTSRTRQNFASTPAPISRMKLTQDIKENGIDSRLREKEKPIQNSVSSAEDESGFSSMNSFHDIGLPLPTISQIKEGCHTEVGLPEIPLDKINHRRWSSTPAEIQAMFKKYKNGYLTGPTKIESMSVWV